MLSQSKANVAPKCSLCHMISDPSWSRRNESCDRGQGRDIQDHNLQKAGYGQSRRLMGRKVCNRAAWRPSSLVT